MEILSTNIRASVIIPTYNRADVILRSLETWTKQIFPNDKYEVIIVDNNSTDSSAEIIQHFILEFPNFIYINESKPGSTNARHAGAKIAQSDVLIFADDDGLFNENCIEEILHVYQLNNEIDAVAGKIDILWDNTPPEWIIPYEFMLGKLDYGDKIVWNTGLFLNGGLFSIKKEAFEELEGFNPDLIGNYLIGDGDTGLVIKLHNENRLIGWTPFAHMFHLQFVGRQGTIQDMGRRFYNLGISHSYGYFRLNNFKWNGKILIHILNSSFFLIKKFIEYITARKTNKKKLFSFMQRKGELDFFFNVIVLKRANI